MSARFTATRLAVAAGAAVALAAAPTVAFAADSNPDLVQTPKNGSQTVVTPKLDPSQTVVTPKKDDSQTVKTPGKAAAKPAANPEDSDTVRSSSPKMSVKELGDYIVANGGSRPSDAALKSIHEALGGKKPVKSDLNSIVKDYPAAKGQQVVRTKAEQDGRDKHNAEMGRKIEAQKKAAVVAGGTNTAPKPTAVKTVPKGGVKAGNGGSATTEDNTALYIAGGLGVATLAAAGGVVVMRRNAGQN
jgi:hypothetical protein